MQLVQTTRDALLKPLSTVAGIVERRHTLPILANILMRKEGNKVAKKTVEKMVKEAVLGAEKSSKSKQTKTSRKIKLARTKIPELTKLIVKEVEKS